MSENTSDADRAALPELPKPLIEYRATFGTIIGFTSDQMREYAQAALAYARSEGVHVGWKLVPIEPTLAMVEAWNSSGAADYKVSHLLDSDYAIEADLTPEKLEAWSRENAGKDWKAMLNAAPMPPQSNGLTDADEGVLSRLVYILESGRAYNGISDDRADIYSAALRRALRLLNESTTQTQDENRIAALQPTAEPEKEGE